MAGIPNNLGGKKIETKEDREYLASEFIQEKSLLATLLPGLYEKLEKSANKFNKEHGKDNATYPKVLEISSQLNAIKNISASIARSVSVLPAIQRDINIMRQNLILISKKLTSHEKVTPDEFFRRAEEKERIYEEQFGRDSLSPTKVVEEEKKRGFSLLSAGLMGAAALGLMKYFKDPEFKEKINSMINSFGFTVFGEENWKGVTETFQKTAEEISKSLKDNWGKIAVALGVLITPLVGLHLAVATASNAIMLIAKQLWQLGTGALKFPFKGRGVPKAGVPPMDPKGKVPMRMGAGPLGTLLGLGSALGVDYLLEEYDLPNYGRETIEKLENMMKGSYEKVDKKIPKTKDEQELLKKKFELESAETILQNYERTKNEKIDELGESNYNRKIDELKLKIAILKKDVEHRQKTLKEKKESHPTTGQEKKEDKSPFGMSFESFTKKIKSSMKDQYDAMFNTPMTPLSPERVPQVGNIELEDKILSVVKKFEAGQNDPYNTMNQGDTKRRGNSMELLGKKLTEMTIGEIMEYQKKSGKDKLFAAGAYQITPDTLKGLINNGVASKNELFDEETQTKLARELLRGRMKGAKSLEQLIRNISQEWAVFSDPSTGKSFYDGIGGNKSNKNADKELMSLLSGEEYNSEDYKNYESKPLLDVKEPIEDGYDYIKELFSIGSMKEVAEEVGKRTGLSYKYIEATMSELLDYTLDRLNMPQPVIIQQPSEQQEMQSNQGAPDTEISSVADQDFIYLLFSKSMWGTPTTA